VRATLTPLRLRGSLCVVCLSLVLVLAQASAAYEWKRFAPEARCGHQAVVDTVNGQMVLAAGWGESGYMNDVWGLHCERGLYWRHIMPAGPAPPGRMQYALVLDTGDHALIMFGGNAGGTLLNDVWKLTLTPGSETWTDLSPPGQAPEPRLGPVAVYDPITHRVVIFGGVSEYATFFNDVWAFDLATSDWTQVYPSGTPPSGRREAAAIYDPEGHRMIVFGGYNDPEQFLNDTWALNLEGPGSAMSWVELTPSGGPPAVRRGHDVTYDWVAHRMLVHGGWNYPWFQFFRDVWALDLATLTWSQIPGAGQLPMPARNQSVVFFAKCGIKGILTFGGNVWDAGVYKWHTNECFMLLD